MSHVKNVVSYSRLVDICTGYGGTYNPGRQTLQLKVMRALLKEAQSSLHDVSRKRNAFNSVTNERARAYRDLNVLTSKVIGILKALQVPAQTLADARYYTRLIGGRLTTSRLPVPSEDSDAPSLSTRASTQQSYVAKAFNWYRLAQMISELPGYVTNEPTLKVEALLETAEKLNQLNEDWSRAKVALTNARIHRDKLLYNGQDALVNHASAVKSYVRVVFGYYSGQTDQLRALRFTKPKVR